MSSLYQTQYFRDLLKFYSFSSIFINFLIKMSKSVRELRKDSFRVQAKYYDIKEQYEMARGKKADWGIGGYSVPKTVQYLDHNHKFPVDKRKDVMTEAMKRSNEPDPAKYSPDMKTNLERNWLSASGKFLSSKKITIIDELMAKSNKELGPGKYLKEPKKIEKKDNFG